MKTLTVKSAKANLNVDSVGKNKAGNIVVRRGYFYTFGKDAHYFKSEVCTKLNKAGIEYEVVDYGNHFTAFRGGASVKNQSHWWVELKPIEDKIVDCDCKQDCDCHRE